jgi:hypothetical protein
MNSEHEDSAVDLELPHAAFRRDDNHTGQLDTDNSTQGSRNAVACALALFAVALISSSTIQGWGLKLFSDRLHSSSRVLQLSGRKISVGALGAQQLAAQPKVFDIEEQPEDIRQKIHARQMICMFLTSVSSSFA